MTEDLLTDLEHIVQSEPFVILDTSALIYRDGPNGNGFLDDIYGKDLIQIPALLLENALNYYERLQDLLQPRTAFVTKEVFLEVQRGIEATDVHLQHVREKICRTISGRLRIERDDSQKRRLIDLAGDVQDAMGKTLQMLKTRVLTFNVRSTYKSLFEFLKYLLPEVKYTSYEQRQKKNLTSQRLQKYDYLFGDESIAAATLYYTFCPEENHAVTAVVTQDHGIKREMRAAYTIFKTINPDRFEELVTKVPFKVYAITGQPARYIPRLDTKDLRTIKDLTCLQAVVSSEKIDDWLEVAYDVFNSIC